MPGISDNTQLLTRVAKLYFQESGPRLDDFLRLFWPTVKLFDSAEIPVDRAAPTQKMARYREVGGASNLFAYEPGEGKVYDPAILAEATPIDEELSRAVTAGIEASAATQEHMIEKIRKIIEDHAILITSAIVKQAMDIMTFGTFQPRGKNGVNVGGAFNFGRDPANTVAAAANPVTQLQACLDQLRAKGGGGRIATLVGADVLSALETNSDFQDALKLQGLYAGISRLVGENSVLADIIPGGVKIPGRAARTNLLTFDESYVDETGALVPYMNPKGIIMTTLDSPRVQAYGSISVSDPATGGNRIMTGKMIVSHYNKVDPDTQVIRTQSRPMLIPGNITHIVYAEIT